MAAAPPRIPLVLVFDSGLGGLTVFREIVNLCPGVGYAYFADDAGFPYGTLSGEALTARVCEVVGRAIEMLSPDCVVIACNTASTLVLPHLRARHDIPFVGTVPAVKPAAALSRTGLISVLATPGTAKRDYTRDLIASFAAHCAVHLVGSGKLAALTEAEMSGSPVSDADILAEIAPCFREEQGKRTDVVVLACTHFPLLLERFERLAPWPVAWVDPAPAIARRAAGLLGAVANASPLRTRSEAKAYFSSGLPPTPRLIAMLARFGLEIAQAGGEARLVSLSRPAASR